MSADETKIQSYLDQLRASLRGMTLAEREDIVEEIHMHIRERGEAAQTSIDGILAALGPADELAQQYRTGALVQKARTSISPLTILRAALNWGLTGVKGFVVFLIALCGYSAGAGFLLLALLKPLFPKNVGLWVGAGNFDFSFRTDALSPSLAASGIHEVLGWWFLPVTLVLGALSLTGTTKLIQLLMRRFRAKVPASLPQKSATPAAAR